MKDAYANSTSNNAAVHRTKYLGAPVTYIVTSPLMVDQSKELEEIEIFIAQNRRFVDWSTFNVRGKNEEFSQTKTTHLKVKLSTSNSAKSTNQRCAFKGPSIT